MQQPTPHNTMSNRRTTVNARAAAIVVTVGVLMLCTAPAEAVRVLDDVPEDGWQQTNVKTTVGELPEHVPTVEGKFTAFADFEHAENRDGTVVVPLYLINRTDKIIEVSYQDGSTYFMLEVNINGRWVRAEPHQFSWCGNSYGSVILRPGTFYQARGWFPADGKPALGRFHRAYNADSPVASNSGQVFFSEKALQQAQLDPLAIAMADLDTALKVISGELKPTLEDHTQPRANAVRRLGDIGGREAALHLVRFVTSDDETLWKPALDALRWHAKNLPHAFAPLEHYAKARKDAKGEQINGIRQVVEELRKHAYKPVN